MKILALKLATSEELIGEMVQDETNSVSLKNVVLVAIQQTPDGRAALGFLPFMPYLGKEKTISFNKDKIIVQEEVDEQMRTQYNSVFGGGIVVPPKQLITG